MQPLPVGKLLAASYEESCEDYTAVSLTMSVHCPALNSFSKLEWTLNHFPYIGVRDKEFVSIFLYEPPQLGLRQEFEETLHHKDTRNCPEKAMKISHFNTNQSAPSIYIMIELCYFSLDQWEIRIHLLWGKSFNIPHHYDPDLNQTKWLIFNDLLPLTIPGVLGHTN